MGYDSLRSCLLDLEKTGQMVRIPEPVDPDLEMAEIQRRVFAAQGPAVFYEHVIGSPFPAVSNLFGTLSRVRYIFRKELDRVKDIFRLKADPSRLLTQPFRQFGLLPLFAKGCPRRVRQSPVLACQTTVSQLPQIRAWPEDGGAYIFLPQVYTENPESPGIRNSNLGMYRIQISGNEYEQNREVGIHYQMRRDMERHHAKAIALNRPLRVSIFVGGPPAHSFAAVMYLPENFPEAVFAGWLGNRQFRYVIRDGFTISHDADFCITGWIHPAVMKPEGPFGDHLGYYSQRHPFPVVRVERVYHRRDAVWPFTIVGRPPQEDSYLGKLVQEIGGPLIPKEIPGVKAVHAVDASGVHPLMLAIGREGYIPYGERKPRQLLTLANALLGYGPCSLAKYLMMVSEEDAPSLDIQDIGSFFEHVLCRADWTTDLHFQTQTTMDTLDYSGTGLHQGSKVVIAVAGGVRRKLETCLPENLKLPDFLKAPKFALPGVLVLEGIPFETYEQTAAQIRVLDVLWREMSNLNETPLMVIADDSRFTADNLSNFLWVTFTRSDPSRDIYGIKSFTEFKHWGCSGPLIIDAREKPHHAPPVKEDCRVTERVNRLGAPGKCLHGII